jgi:hypothetical protein
VGQQREASDQAAQAQALAAQTAEVRQMQATVS